MGRGGMVRTDQLKLKFRTVSGILKCSGLGRKGVPAGPPGKSGITVVTTFPVFPPQGGGQNRIYYLYREVAKSVRVEIVSLGNTYDRPLTEEIAPGLWEHRVPKSIRYAIREKRIGKHAGIPVTDIAFIDLYERTPGMIEAFRKSSRYSVIVVSSQPYPFHLVKKYFHGKVVHESHNGEYLLKKQIFSKSNNNEVLLERVFKAEKEACIESCFTTVCTAHDGRNFERLYGLEPSKMLEVSNGVDTHTIRFCDETQRRKNRDRVFPDNRTTALFIASYHQPNIDAVQAIMAFSDCLPQVRFIIIGSVGMYFENADVPDNVVFRGVVDDGVKNSLLGAADVALNPVSSGSGSNLKMFEYMASGIPVLSTPFGARGIGGACGLMTVCPLERFADHLSLCDFEGNKTKPAREYVEEKHDWRQIARPFLEALEKSGL